MKVCLLLLLSVLASAYAHTYFSSITVDGRAYNEGECVKKHPIGTANFPINFVTDADMTCGWRPLADQPTDKKCPVNPGSRVSIQWHYQSATAGDMILDHSHKGPVLVYLAKSDTGAGPVWFKIYEEGLINGNSNPAYWATDKLIQNGGKLEFTIPADIAPGNYLLRGEIIALHSAHQMNGAQPYIGCAEITIGGSGTANPAGVYLPGAYKNTDPGIYINIYNGLSSYVIPGPAVYQAGSAPSSSGSNPPPQPTSAPVPSTPTSGISVYTDSVQNPIFSDWSWASVKNPQDTAFVYSGSYSYSFVPQQWQAVFLSCQGCIDTAKFDRIEFYVNGGTSGGQNVNLYVIKGGTMAQPSNSIAYYTNSNIPAGSWVKGSVPLSLFAAGQYDGIWFQARSENAQGTLYIDQITLIPKTRTGFAPSDTGVDSDAETPSRSTKTTTKTDASTLVLSNVLTAAGTLVVVAVVVVSVYMYRKRKTASDYQYNQFVENGQL